MSRFRIAFLIAALVALATAFSACGGDDGGGEDPQKVLDATFSGGQTIDSANLDITADLSVEGEQSGNLTASLTGPYQSEGKNKLPQLDFTAKVNAEGGGQSFDFEGGLISTGDRAFVSYGGTDYEVDSATFNTFKSAFESAASQQQQNQTSSGQLLEQLGIEDPSSLLTNLSSEGDADVEGTSTTHISGDLDVDKTIEAFKSLLSNASALGGLGGVDTSQLPSGAELEQVKSAIKDAHFDIYSGKDDDILRRLTVQLGIEPPSGSGVDTIDINLDVTLGSVNEPQTIEAPSGAKPLSDLLEQFGISPESLGSLGGLGGVGGTGGPGGAGGTGGLGGTTGGGTAQEYLDCVSKASTAADLQACQALAP